MSERETYVLHYGDRLDADIEAQRIDRLALKRGEWLPTATISRARDIARDALEEARKA